MLFWSSSHTNFIYFFIFYSTILNLRHVHCKSLLLWHRCCKTSWILFWNLMFKCGITDILYRIVNIKSSTQRMQEIYTSSSQCRCTSSSTVPLLHYGDLQLQDHGQTCHIQQQSFLSLQLLQISLNKNSFNKLQQWISQVDIHPWIDVQPPKPSKLVPALLWKLKRPWPFNFLEQGIQTYDIQVWTRPLRRPHCSPCGSITPNY